MASYFNWTDANKYEFAALVHKEHGHMKTEETYNVKWEKILTKLKEKSNFSELKIKAPALRITFERFKDAVLKECGISEEGANLSGLKAPISGLYPFLTPKCTLSYPFFFRRSSVHLGVRKG